ncbi:hypothetical protein [Streptomyces sp. NBC_00328]|uniref:hypothetical protein n=1 Tax=Streptomyces sp. NBC_00328 TaxID=2903646 RepID=UPI003FA6AAD8
MRMGRRSTLTRWQRWRSGPTLRIPPGADDVENANRRFLLYGVLPLWFVPTVADWVMHRRSDRKRVDSALGRVRVRAVSAGPGRHELSGSGAGSGSAGRCGGGVAKPGLVQDGDGADDRTGWPAVIRGRRERDRS